MSFDAAYIQRLDKQMQSAQRELDRVDRFERQHRRMADTMLGSLGNTLQGVAARALEQHRVPLQRTAAEVTRPLLGTMLQNVTKSMETTQVRRYQNIAGAGFMQQRIVDAAQLATPQLRIMNGLDTSMLEGRMRSMDKMSELARSLAQPYALHGGASMSAFSSFNTTLAQLNRLASSPVLGMLQDLQVQQAPLLGGQVAKAISEVVRISPAWGQLSAALRDYRLRDVWVMPQAREPSPTHQPPQPDPATAAEASLVPEQVTEAPGTPEEILRPFDRGWRLLLPPVKNTLHSIRHPPLVVRVIAINLGKILIQVIAGGIVYFLFYSS